MSRSFENLNFVRCVVMRNHKIGLGVLMTILAVVSTSISSDNLSVILTSSQVLAQTTKESQAQADRLLEEGLQQFNTSQFEAALQSWQQALIIYREIKNSQGEGGALGNLGLAYLSLGNYPKAIEYLQQSLAIAQQIKDRQNEGKALGNLGTAYLSLEDYPKAIEYLQQDLAIAREFKDRQGEGQSLGNLGTAYLSVGDYPKAIQYLQQRLAIARQIQDRQGEGKGLANLGDAYYRLRDYPKAIEYGQQSLVILREIKDLQSEMKVLGNLGSAYQSLKNYPKAIEYLQQDLVIARQIKDRQRERRALGNLGDAYLSLGDYRKTIEYHLLEFAIVHQIKDHQSEERALDNLGLAYYFLGNYPKAIEYQQQWLVIARQIKDREGEGAALGNLGLAYLSLGDYPKAIEYQQQLLVIARQIKDRELEGKALGNLGGTYSALGDYPKAIEYLQQDLVIARQIKDHEGEGKVLGNLGLAYLSLGDYPKAIEYLKQDLAIARQIEDRQGEGESRGNLGLAYLSLGDYPKAIEYEQQYLTIARQIKFRSGEGKALGNLGLAYLSLEDYSKAIEYLQQRLAIAREIKDRQSEEIALNNLGVALYKKGNLSLAEKTLFEGITVGESLRGGLNDTNKVSIFEKQRSTYNTLQKVLIAQNQTDAALEIAERGRARAFVDLLALSLNSHVQPKPPTIGEMKQIAKQQSSTLVQYSIIYDDFKVGGKQQFQESELYIWVIKPTGEVTFRKADLKPLWQKDHTSLGELVIDSRESIDVRGIISVQIPSVPKAQNQFKRLHKLLIQPIADLLPKKETSKVIFIPQSSLFLVPFPALQDEKGQYLIEKHTILTSPSIQVLGLTHQRKKGNGKWGIGSGDALVVGNPTMPKVSLKIGEPPRQLRPLPGAEKEANAIASLLKTQPLISHQATKAAVLQRLPGARIVHFATHGILDNILGLKSSIALAPSGKDDGLLTAQEILDLKLNAQLVVLSACDTGIGRVTGDGVIGLSRSLISAGVPSVIVSLWKIDDNSSAFLMTQFYQNLQENQDKATALRNAMLATKQKYSSPSQWAAFTLIGETE